MQTMANQLEGLDSLSPRLLFKCLDAVRTGVATEFVVADAAGWTLSRGFAFTVSSGAKSMA